MLCEHLREAMARELTLPSIFRVEAWYLGQAVWSYCLCPACACDNRIIEKRTIWRDDDSLDRLFAMKCNMVPICVKCFDLAKQVRS
jgi:hypothetical protein